MENTKIITLNKENCIISKDGTISQFNYANESSLIKVIIPSKIDEQEIVAIGPGLFYMVPNLISVEIENGIEKIGHSAFLGCENLKNINIPNSIISIEKNAFTSCEKLENINVPEKVKEIKEETFCDCKSLKNISLSNGLANIKSRAFLSCISLKSIIIPNSVTSLDPYAFWGCKDLEIAYKNATSELNKLISYDTEMNFINDNIIIIPTKEIDGFINDYLAGKTSNYKNAVSTEIKEKYFNKKVNELISNTDDLDVKLKLYELKDIVKYNRLADEIVMDQNQLYNMQVEYEHAVEKHIQDVKKCDINKDKFDRFVNKDKLKIIQDNANKILGYSNKENDYELPAVITPIYDINNSNNNPEL